MMLAALLVVAAAAFAGWCRWRTGEQPRQVGFSFPESAPASEALADLRACATIEEAMLFKVMGVVRNLSKTPLRYATAQVAFLDERGIVLDQSQGLVVPEVLESRRDGRFVLVTRPDPRIAAVAVRLTDAEGTLLPTDYSLREPARGFVHP